MKISTLVKCSGSNIIQYFIHHLSEMTILLNIVKTMEQYAYLQQIVFYLINNYDITARCTSAQIPNGKYSITGMQVTGHLFCPLLMTNKITSLNANLSYCVRQQLLSETTQMLAAYH